MGNGWLLLTFGEDRQYGGNAGYADDPSRIYRYDSLVPNSRRLAVGDVVVLRDRSAMLGIAVIQEITSRAGSKTLRRCPTCTTTKFGERSSLQPKFRCKRGHEFNEPALDEKPCEEFEARFGASFRSAAGALSLADLRAACRRYTDQLSMQALDLGLIAHALEGVGLRIDDLHDNRSVLGAEYRAANEVIVSGHRDPFDVDPQVVERGTRGHAITQNALASFVRSNGLEPRSPLANEPEFDIAWCDGTTTFVAEVKSITDSNEEKQLRLGLGQVLRYRHLLMLVYPAVVAVLAVEREPREESWKRLCADLGVLLVWPGRFEIVLAN